MGLAMGFYDPKPYSQNLGHWPKIVTQTVPGPKRAALHGRAAMIIRGLSGQVKLFPVCLRIGQGLRADGCRWEPAHRLLLTGLGSGQGAVDRAGDRQLHRIPPRQP